MEPLTLPELSISVNQLKKKRIPTQEYFWVTWMLREFNGQRLPKLQVVTLTFWQEDISGKVTKITITEQVMELDTSWVFMKDQLVFPNTTKRFLNQT